MYYWELFWIRNTQKVYKNKPKDRFIQPQIRLYFRYFENSKQRRSWGYEICFVCECSADEISWTEKISWDFIGGTFTNKTNLVTSRIFYIEKYWASQFFWNPIFVAKYIVGWSNHPNLYTTCIFFQLNLQFGLTQLLSCLLLMFALTTVMPKKVSEQFMKCLATSLKLFLLQSTINEYAIHCQNQNLLTMIKLNFK